MVAVDDDRRALQPVQSTQRLQEAVKQQERAPGLLLEVGGDGGGGGAVVVAVGAQDVGIVGGRSKCTNV